MKRRMTLMLLLASLLGAKAPAQTYKPTAENLQSRQEFRDAKFGIFLHWGL